MPLPVGSGQVFHRDHPVRTGLVTSKPVGLALVLVTWRQRTSSAALLSSIRRSFSESREETTEHPGIVEATQETWRFARRDHRVLSLLAVKFGFGAAAGLLALIPVMAIDVFDSGNIGFGILMAARGVGALIGPFLGHRIAGPGHRRLFPAIGLSLAVFGLVFVIAIVYIG